MKAAFALAVIAPAVESDNVDLPVDGILCEATGATGKHSGHGKDGSLRRALDDIAEYCIPRATPEAGAEHRLRERAESLMNGEKAAAG